LQHTGTIATAAVAALHIYIMVLEMFLWNTPKGRKVFGLSPEFASASKVLAANQGLYNGFLAAGLIWGIYLGAAGNPVKIFFLSCVVIAGIYGAISSSKKILFVQGLPGAIALFLVLLSDGAGV
jgi:putative membrane protein